jgi:hypothetical protein
MGQRASPLYLTRKGLSAVEIYADLVAMLGPESVSYPSVTNYFRQAKFGTSKPSIIFLNPNRSAMIQMRVSFSP